MEKIIFFGLVIPIFLFVLYLGGRAIMTGFSAKSSNKSDSEIEANNNVDNSENLTEELNKLWTWEGDKYNLNQYLFEIEVNGLICSRIYNSVGWALLDEIHPIEKEYRSHHTYKCDESGSLYLFGDPFYYCLLYTSPSPRDATLSRMPSSA